MKFFLMNNFAVIGKSFNFVRENVIVFLVHLLSKKEQIIFNYKLYC